MGLGFGLAAGCLLELEHELACGDGRVDVLAGEQCDPRASDSPHLTYCIDKNLGNGSDGKGAAVCNEECQIEADQEICAFCGDGIAAADEQCDGSDLRGQVCPSGDGQLACNKPSEPAGIRCTFDISGCNQCGDGQFNEKIEECDFSTQCNDDEDCDEGMECDESKQTCVMQGDIGLGYACTNLKGPKDEFYTHGIVNNSDCTHDCLYERRRCSYCGDGELDPAYEDYGSPNNFMQKAELCDGDASDKDALVEYCQDLCTGGPNTTLVLRCEFKCNENCDGFEEQAWEDPIKDSARCCVLGGEPCDLAGDFPCCYALDHPEGANSACVDALPKPVCRSG